MIKTREWTRYEVGDAEAREFQAWVDSEELHAQPFPQPGAFHSADYLPSGPRDRMRTASRRRDELTGFGIHSRESRAARSGVEEPMDAHQAFLDSEEKEFFENEGELAAPGDDTRHIARDQARRQVERMSTQKRKAFLSGDVAETMFGDIMGDEPFTHEDRVDERAARRVAMARSRLGDGSSGLLEDKTSVGLLTAHGAKPVHPSMFVGSLAREYRTSQLMRRGGEASSSKFVSSKGKTRLGRLDTEAMALRPLPGDSISTMEVRGDAVSSSRALPGIRTRDGVLPTKVEKGDGRVAVAPDGSSRDQQISRGGGGDSRGGRVLARDGVTRIFARDESDDRGRETHAGTAVEQQRAHGTAEMDGWPVDREVGLRGVETDTREREYRGARGMAGMSSGTRISGGRTGMRLTSVSVLDGERVKELERGRPSLSSGTRISGGRTGMRLASVSVLDGERVKELERGRPSLSSGSWASGGRKAQADQVSMLSGEMKDPSRDMRATFAGGWRREGMALQDRHIGTSKPHALGTASGTRHEDGTRLPGRGTLSPWSDSRVVHEVTRQSSELGDERSLTDFEPSADLSRREVPLSRTGRAGERPMFEHDGGALADEEDRRMASRVRMGTQAQGRKTTEEVWASTGREGGGGVGGERIGAEDELRDGGSTRRRAAGILERRLATDGIATALPRDRIGGTRLEDERWSETDMRWTEGKRTFDSRKIVGLTRGAKTETLQGRMDTTGEGDATRSLAETADLKIERSRTWLRDDDSSTAHTGRREKAQFYDEGGFESERARGIEEAKGFQARRSTRTIAGKDVRGDVGVFAAQDAATRISGIGEMHDLTGGGNHGERWRPELEGLSRKASLLQKRTRTGIQPVHGSFGDAESQGLGRKRDGYGHGAWSREAGTRAPQRADGITKHMPAVSAMTLAPEGATMDMAETLSIRDASKIIAVPRSLHKTDRVVGQGQDSFVAAYDPKSGIPFEEEIQVRSAASGSRATYRALSKSSVARGVNVMGRARPPDGYSDIE